jgi:biopolymer transport protein ExbD
MKIRQFHIGREDKVEMQMTPMIDIVFQLLAFFTMSFKIGVEEGDFNVKMPLAAPSAGVPDESLLPPLKLKLMADEDGRLRPDGIQLNERSFADFAGLHGYIRSLVGEESGPGSVGDLEIEIDCDYQLRYASAIEAVTAVSGYIDANGNIVKLIEKIKFPPPKAPSGDQNSNKP